MPFKFSSLAVFVEFCKQMRFFCLFWWEMFTTDMIVYPGEQNQTRYENQIYKWTQANLLSRNETDLIGLRFSTCVNIASGEFCGSSYNTSCLSNKKFLRIFMTCPLVNTSGNFFAPAIKCMICMDQTLSVCDDKIYKILSDSGKLEIRKCYDPKTIG